MKSNYSLSQKIQNQIIDLAKQCEINKVILFGSRARGDNKERSDIDIAVSGDNVEKFKSEIDDFVETLLVFDVVNLDTSPQPELIESIKREGIIIYEKI